MCLPQNSTPGDAPGEGAIDMRKLLKHAFSQTAVVVLLLLAQVSVLLVSVWRLSQYSGYIYGILLVISLLMVLRVISSDSNPSFQTSWVILILALPVFGGLFYLFIFGQQHSHRYLKQLEREWRRLGAKLRPKDTAGTTWQAAFPQDARAVRYLQSLGFYASSTTEATYLSPGEAWGKLMLEQMRRAKQYIFLEFFIIEEGQFWNEILSVLREKAAAGVDVRVMYDGMGCIGLRRDYPKRLEAMGIHCKVFNPFRPFLAAVQNNRDHRKICVIDGACAFTGGANLSDEYVNVTHPYGHWKDAALMVRGKAAFTFTTMFLSMWQLTEHTVVEYTDFLPAETPQVHPDGLLVPFCDNPLNDEQIGEYLYLHAIRSADRYLHICSPYLILDYTMSRALELAAKSGVEVQLVLPSVADHWYAYAAAKAYCAQLIRAGVQIYTYTPGFIHSKTFVWDDSSAIVGSVNLDFRSLYMHFEAAVWMREGKAVRDVEEDFRQILKVASPMTLEDCQPKGLLSRFGHGLLRIFAPLM